MQFLAAACAEQEVSNEEINGSSPNLAGEMYFNSCWPFEVSMEAWVLLTYPKDTQIFLPSFPPFLLPLSIPSLPHPFPASLGSSPICTSMHGCVRACVPPSSRPFVRPCTLFFLSFYPPSVCPILFLHLFILIPQWSPRTPVTHSLTQSLAQSHSADFCSV